MLTPITFHDGAIELIDQTRLPQEVVTLTVRDYRELADAIREMRIRGAPRTFLLGQLRTACRARV